MSTITDRFWGSVHAMATIQRVIGQHDSRWAWDRAALRQRTSEALWEALNRHLRDTVETEVQARLDAHTPVNAAQYALEHAAGYRQGHQAALIEAATMLKRAGHRSAVTRVLELADAPVLVPQTPARSQPATSPADGPGPVDPQDGVYDYGTRTWHPVPTPPENGAQRQAQGLYVHTAQEWEDGGGRG